MLPLMEFVLQLGIVNVACKHTINKDSFTIVSHSGITAGEHFVLVNCNSGCCRRKKIKKF